MELSGGTVDTERICIGATERIGECVLSIRICDRYRSADILPRCCILCYTTCGVITVIKYRRVVCIYQVDRNVDGCIVTRVIRNANRDGVGVLGFKVEGCMGLQLPKCAIDAKGGGIGAAEGVSQRTIIIFIRCRHCRADV